MPGFAHLVLSAPQGFIAGCKQFNSTVETNAAAKDSIVEACVVSRREDHSVTDTSMSWPEEVKVLSYLVNCFERASPKPTVPEMASILDTNTFLAREAITVIIAGIDSISNSNSSTAVKMDALMEIRKTSNFGRLSNLQWRLGVSLSSSSCQNLSAPYVALSFDVVDNNGRKTVHTTEMTYSDFVKFQADFAKVDNVMNAM